MLYCITHGKAHAAAEAESISALGDDLPCIQEEWPIVAGEAGSSQCEDTAPADLAFVLEPGSLAYLDTLRSGLVPVKVTGVAIDRMPGGDEWRWPEPTVTVKVTGGRPGYERGEVIELHAPNLTLVHRAQVHIRCGQYRIRGQAHVRDTEGRLL